MKAASLSRLRSCSALAIALLACTSLAASDVRADGRDWFGFTDSGLGFVARLRDRKVCKDALDELAGAATSLSPETWGASVGLALGAAAGAATTRSVIGTLRGGIVVGSIGSALGHLAEVFAPNQVGEWADNLQDLLQARDGKLCELIKANDKARIPVMQHLSTAISRECAIDAAALTALDPSAGAQLERCVAGNTRAARSLTRHTRVLRSINRGTCHIATALVLRFNAHLAKRGDASREMLTPYCDDVPQPQTADDDLGEQFL